MGLNDAVSRYAKITSVVLINSEQISGVVVMVLVTVLVGVVAVVVSGVVLLVGVVGLAGQNVDVTYVRVFPSCHDELTTVNDAGKASAIPSRA